MNDTPKTPDEWRSFNREQDLLNPRAPKIKGKQKVIITKGLPGSGKSTWARKLMEDSPGTWKRVNKDDLRAMLDSSVWSKSNEEFVILTRNFIILEALKAGKNVIVDDTNFGRHFEDIKGIVGNLAEVEIKDFTDVPLQICIEHDLKRFNSVGKDVIVRMYNQHLHPNKVSVGERKLREHDPTLRNAILCDLDGTLALLNGRNPYDASTSDKDGLNVPVAETLRAFTQAYPDTKIIFMSGRSDEFRPQTVDFLESHGFYTYEMDKSELHPEFDYVLCDLNMRKKGDSRKDSIIKEELFNEVVNSKYNVLFVMDDRDQVVAKWRQMGLTVFQVAEGDF